jgi:hypothetical protein
MLFVAYKINLVKLVTELAAEAVTLSGSVRFESRLGHEISLDFLHSLQAGMVHLVGLNIFPSKFFTLHDSSIIYYLSYHLSSIIYHLSSYVSRPHSLNVDNVENNPKRKYN